MKLEAKQRLTAMKSLSLNKWKVDVLRANPRAQFTMEDGSGKTYGELGDWTAHIGPDMQAHVVGTYSWENDVCWFMGANKEIHEFGTEGKPVHADAEEAPTNDFALVDPVSEGDTFDTMIDGEPNDHVPVVQLLTNDDGSLTPADEQPLLIDDLPVR